MISILSKTRSLLLALVLLVPTIAYSDGECYGPQQRPLSALPGAELVEAVQNVSTPEEYLSLIEKQGGYKNFIDDLKEARFLPYHQDMARELNLWQRYRKLANQRNTNIIGGVSQGPRGPYFTYEPPVSLYTQQEAWGSQGVLPLSTVEEIAAQEIFEYEQRQFKEGMREFLENFPHARRPSTRPPIGTPRPRRSSPIFEPLESKPALPVTNPRNCKPREGSGPPDVTPVAIAAGASGQAFTDFLTENAYDLNNPVEATEAEMMQNFYTDYVFGGALIGTPIWRELEKARQSQPRPGRTPRKPKSNEPVWLPPMIISF